MMQLRPEHWIGVGLLVFGLTSGIVASALDYWYYVEGSVEGESVDLYFGLWEVCSYSCDIYNFTINGTLDCTTDCNYWGDVDKAWGPIYPEYPNSQLVTKEMLHYIQACRSLMIIGLVLNIAAIAVAVKQWSFRAVVAIVGGLCYGIAASIFSFKFSHGLAQGNHSGHLHAGFGLAIVAAGINVVFAPALLGGAGRRASQQTRAGYTEVQ